MASEDTPLLFATALFRQTPRRVRQDICERRQEMPEKALIFRPSQVYLLQIGEWEARIQHDAREDRHAHDARSLPDLEPTPSVER